MKTINYLINELVNYTTKNNILSEENYHYAINVCIDFFKVTSFKDEEVSNRDLSEIMDDICSYAYEVKLINSLDVVTTDNFKGKVMDIFMDQPALVKIKFDKLYKESPRMATDYLYQLSKDVDYIKTQRIKKNICFKSPSNFGDLEITINLSKPEKDPKLIAQALKQKSNDKYPKCQLCIENMGYRGYISYDGRSTLRTIKLDMPDNEKWYLQYSPYSYFNEHSICFNSEHTPMVISKRAFTRLLDFIDMFPEYFVGSNADLPIVGGSILTHEHFQAGRYHFPIESAKEKLIKKIGTVEVYSVHWPLSTIRIKSLVKDDLIDVATKILDKWRIYENQELSIYNSLNELHNTITPIARFENGVYVFDLILRCNYQSEEHPLGVFHPHSNLHHIKKENIGLIEAMGLAILPARLKQSSCLIAEYLDGKKENINLESLQIHHDWILEIEKTYNGNNSLEYVYNQIGNVFEKVLIDAGVFKQDATGQQEFEKFINSIK